MLSYAEYGHLHFHRTQRRVMLIHADACLAASADETDPDDMQDEKANPWNLWPPFNEMIALWSDTLDDVKRAHDASAHN